MSSLSGKLHSSLEDRHLPTVVHDPVVHQLHVPAVGKEVVHTYDSDDIDQQQHQQSIGSPPQQVLEQERVLIIFFP